MSSFFVVSDKRSEEWIPTAGCAYKLATHICMQVRNSNRFPVHLSRIEVTIKTLEPTLNIDYRYT